MAAFAPARDAHLILAIPVFPFFPGPSGISLPFLFLAEPRPIVSLSGVKYNIYCVLFRTFYQPISQITVTVSASSMSSGRMSMSKLSQASSTAMPLAIIGMRMVLTLTFRSVFA